MIFTRVGCDWNTSVFICTALLCLFREETNILCFRHCKVGGFLKV